jgi:hypothetical protein
MKTRILFAFVAMFSLVLIFSSCSKDSILTADDGALIEKSGQADPGTCPCCGLTGGTCTLCTLTGGTCTTCSFTGTLTDTEKTNLLWMREEEKLARDVYSTLYSKYKVLTFKNISKSEQAHMDAILFLIKGYKLEDPVKADETGKFTNPAFTALYASLIAKGSISLTEAYKTGVDIEILDIKDLKDAIGKTDKVNIQRVYTNLSSASAIHLKSFTYYLTRLGITYP